MQEAIFYEVKVPCHDEAVRLSFKKRVMLQFARFSLEDLVKAEEWFKEALDHAIETIKNDKKCILELRDIWDSHIAKVTVKTGTPSIGFYDARDVSLASAETDAYVIVNTFKQMLVLYPDLKAAFRKIESEQTGHEDSEEERKEEYEEEKAVRDKQDSPLPTDPETSDEEFLDHRDQEEIEKEAKKKRRKKREQARKKQKREDSSESESDSDSDSNSESSSSSSSSSSSKEESESDERIIQSIKRKTRAARPTNLVDPCSNLAKKKQETESDEGSDSD